MGMWGRIGASQFQKDWSENMVFWVCYPRYRLCTQQMTTNWLQTDNTSLQTDWLQKLLITHHYKLTDFKLITLHYKLTAHHFKLIDYKLMTPHYKLTDFRLLTLHYKLIALHYKLTDFKLIQTDNYKQTDWLQIGKHFTTNWLTSNW